MKVTIKKGRHSHSNFLFRMLNTVSFGKSFAKKVTFGQECYYPYLNNDSKDFNKLLGVRYFDDHINGGYLVWRPDFERRDIIEVWAYGYENQARYKHKIVNVRVGTEFIASVTKQKDGYLFQVGEEKYYHDHSNPQAWVTVQPYFGGNNKSPHDIHIEMK